MKLNQATDYAFRMIFAHGDVTIWSEGNRRCIG